MEVAIHNVKKIKVVRDHFPASEKSHEFRTINLLITDLAGATNKITLYHEGEVEIEGDLAKSREPGEPVGYGSGDDRYDIFNQ